MVDGRAFLIPAALGVFQELGVSAAVRLGVHPRVWDGTGWHALHNVPSVTEAELEHGVELERVKYNVRSIEQARKTGQVVLGDFAGFSDLFVPFALHAGGDPVPAVIVTGPFARARPSSTEILQRWRSLTGQQGHGGDRQFAHFVELFLGTLVLEPAELRAFTRLLVSLGRQLGSAPDQPGDDFDALRARLSEVRWCERTWEVVRSMVDERTCTTWASPQREGDLKRAGLTRVPDQVMVGLIMPDTARDASEDAVVRDGLLRASTELARTVGDLAAGRVGDYGVVFVSCRPGARARKQARWVELSERVARLARTKFGLRVHFGTSQLPGAAPLSEHYHAALRAAELALGSGERLPAMGTDDAYGVYTLPDDPPNHVIATFHSGFKGLAESKDGGQTWTPHPSTKGSAGESSYFIRTATPGTWLTIGIAYGDSTGLWRTTTCGRSPDCDGEVDDNAWTKINDWLHFHGAFQEVLEPESGTLYIPVDSGVGRSTDSGATWEDVDDGWRSGLVATDEYIYSNYHLDPGLKRATRADGSDWTSYADKPAAMSLGSTPYGNAASSDCTRWVVLMGTDDSGIWRFVEE